ncbi:MAG TPA: DivIVA domain-containing protein [Gaiellaceae bacterium]|nr:DivIVA domain-containing protein [Gaiellaceae bacterium]
MPIKPEEITAENLPQGVRGYQKEATENLLKLVAWDYRRVLREQALDEEELQRLRSKVDQQETELQALRSLLDQQPVDEERHAALQAEVERLQSVLAAQRRRDELPQALLDAALRSAREQRERARAECDELVKAARRRADQIEREARSSVRQSAAELERLHRMERDLRDNLRRMLQEVIDGDASHRNGNGNGNGAVPSTVVELPAAAPAATD